MDFDCSGFDPDRWDDWDWLVGVAQNTSEVRELPPEEFDRVQREHDDAWALKWKGDE